MRQIVYIMYETLLENELQQICYVHLRWTVAGIYEIKTPEISKFAKSQCDMRVTSSGHWICIGILSGLDLLQRGLLK